MPEYVTDRTQMTKSPRYGLWLSSQPSRWQSFLHQLNNSAQSGGRIPPSAARVVPKLADADIAMSLEPRKSDGTFGANATGSVTHTLQPELMEEIGLAPIPRTKVRSTARLGFP
jgi:hypothetical protein